MPYGTKRLPYRPFHGYVTLIHYRISIMGSVICIWHATTAPVVQETWPMCWPPQHHTTVTAAYLVALYSRCIYSVHTKFPSQGAPFGRASWILTWQNTDYGMPNQSQHHSKPNSKKVSLSWSFSSVNDASFLQWCIMTHVTSVPDYYGWVPT